MIQYLSLLIDLVTFKKGTRNMIDKCRKFYEFLNFVKK